MQGFQTESIGQENPKKKTAIVPVKAWVSFWEEVLAHCLYVQ